MTSQRRSRAGRRGAIALALAIGIALLPLSCAEDPAPPPPGPLARQVTALARANGVPADLVLAVAVVEDGLTLPRLRTPSPDDNVPIAGILELRRGKLDTLALGAKLVGRSERALQTDTQLGTKAGVEVLASLGPAGSSHLVDWKDAVARLSGLAPGWQTERYVSQVYGILRFGGTFTARDGERVHIAPHTDIPPSLLIAPPPRHSAAADFPGSIWFQTDCTGKCTTNRPDGNSSVDTIVIHDTEGGWNASVATLQYDSGKSVHYIIDADGSRWGQFVPETYTAWHAGNWCFNKHSIGIEHVGYASNKSGYSTALYKKSAEMVKSIVSRWPNIKIDRDHIVGHYQIPNGNNISECSPPCSLGLDACESSANYGGSAHHTDPGYYWQWCQYMELLGSSCHCNDAWDLFNCTSDGTEMWRCAGGTKLEKQDCANGCDVMPIGQNDQCHGGAAQPDSGTPDAGSDAAPEASGAQGGAGGGAGGEGAAGGAAGGDAGSDAGTGQPTRVTGGDSGGCGCRAAGRRSTPAGAGLVSLLLLGLFWRRRMDA
jgi:N-acetyl-anhydromuramyl-L-alanine amidase AmpD